jgi:hypothetical protein
MTVSMPVISSSQHGLEQWAEYRRERRIGRDFEEERLVVVLLHDLGGAAVGLVLIPLLVGSHEGLMPPCMFCLAAAKRSMLGVCTTGVAITADAIVKIVGGDEQDIRFARGGGGKSVERSGQGASKTRLRELRNWARNAKLIELFLPCARSSVG